MEEILTFAQTVSPLGIIAILAIIIWQLVDGRGILGKILGNSKVIIGTQEEKYPVLEEHVRELKEAYKGLKTFQENHSMHEIPAIVVTMNRIEGKVDGVSEIQRLQGLDIARLKALSEK